MKEILILKRTSLKDDKKDLPIDEIEISSFHFTDIIKKSERYKAIIFIDSNEIKILKDNEDSIVIQ